MKPQSMGSKPNPLYERKDETFTVFTDDEICISRKEYDSLISVKALYLHICDMAHKGECNEAALKECILSTEKIVAQLMPKPLVFYSSEDEIIDLP